ncbi:hypothetical protein, partial [Ruminococcus sp.]|uniref:ParA family protein n=1 Tax=Ruminococcus sp. TaxID=41978 RepID=UPI003AB69E67
MHNADFLLFQEKNPENLSHFSDFHGSKVKGFNEADIEPLEFLLLLRRQTIETVVSVELPAAITMEVAEAPEGVKGDSANNVYKLRIEGILLTMVDNRTNYSKDI